MDIEDYKKENAELHQRVADLENPCNIRRWRTIWTICGYWIRCIT